MDILRFPLIRDNVAMPSSEKRPIVWTIAGSDSGGGAGIQIDLKTMSSLNVHGASAISCITAQNTQGVQNVYPVPLDQFIAQLQSLANDLPPDAVKVGLLPSVEHVKATAEILKGVDCPIVVDPVMVATSGDVLTADTGIPMVEAYRDYLFPIASIFTPNWHEAETLTYTHCDSLAKVSQMSEVLHKDGVVTAFIKGGHAPEQPDFVIDTISIKNGETFWMKTKRLDSPCTHGTGCMLSSAIASFLAHGMGMEDACVLANAFVHQSISNGDTTIGKGKNKPLMPSGGIPTSLDMFPTVHTEHHTLFASYSLPKLTHDLGLYAVMPDAAHVEKAFKAGVRTVQLRVKDLSPQETELEIKQSCEIAARFSDSQLFINDYAELAIKHGAQGVHMGQSDVTHDRLKQLERKGLRVGISTHSPWEVARAKGIQPSYFATGPVYSTTTKVMAFDPQGTSWCGYWVEAFKPAPTCVIGGIFLDNVESALAMNPNGVAVVRDLVQSPDWATHVAKWEALWHGSTNSAKALVTASV